jgi:hypothetical protein
LHQTGGKLFLLGFGLSLLKKIQLKTSGFLHPMPPLAPQISQRKKARGFGYPMTGILFSSINHSQRPVPPQKNGLCE